MREKKWLGFLEQESIARSKYLKAYFVHGIEKGFDKDIKQKELEKIENELNIKNMALTFVRLMADSESEVNLSKINPSVDNTFIIYRHATIIDNYIDLKPTAANFNAISESLDKTKSDYVDLPVPKHD